MRRRLALWSCVKDGYAFVPKAFASAWGAVVLGLLPFAATLLKPVAAFAEAHPDALVGALFVIVTAVVGLVRDGALYRLGVAGKGAKGLGPGGLQFGGVELRLLAGGFLVTLFLLLIFIAGIVVLLFVAAAAGLNAVDWGAVRTPEAMSALAEPWKLWMLAGLCTAIGLLLLRLAVQLSLYAPATVGRGRVVSLDSLALTEGNVLRLTAGLILTYAPTIALLAVRHWTDADLIQFWPVVELVVAGLLQPVLTAGFLSAAYRRLEYLDPSGTGEPAHG